MSDDVIALSRFRAELARSHRRRAEVLLATPESRAMVPALPVQELYYAIQETGLADAHDLLALATVDQFQGLVDLDAWKRDELAPAKVQAWLGALLEIGVEKLGRIVHALDPEIMNLYFLKRTRVYDLTMEEEPPEDTENLLWPTPDGFFVVEFLGAAEESVLDQRIIDAIYRYDLEIARRILQGSKWDLGSDLEESCYRWRTARMADLGYVPFEDAVSIYQPIAKNDARLVGHVSKAGSDEVVPAVLVREVDSQSMLSRMLSSLNDDKELHRIESELMVLLNHAMAADGVDPSDLPRGREIFVRTLGYLDLGIEQLGRGVPENALPEVQKRGLLSAFRVGYSLVARLQSAARTLRDRGRVRIASGRLLLDRPWSDALEAAAADRPMYPRRLDEQDGSGTRPFRALAEVGRLAQMLEEAALWPRLFFEGLGVTSAQLERLIADEADLTFGMMLRAVAFSVLLDRPLAVEPIAGAALRAMVKQLDGADLSAAARARVMAALANTLVEKSLPTLPLDAWLHQATTDLAARISDGKGLYVRLVK